MVFFLGEMNDKFVLISRVNRRNFAAKRREISRQNLFFCGRKKICLIFTFSQRFAVKYLIQY